MSNILIEKLPTAYEGYEVNTDFRIGIQLALLMDDYEYSEIKKVFTMRYLLFGDEQGNLRPSPSDIEGCLMWLLNGWYYDKSSGNEDNTKLMDYDIDQGRIYADFRQIYNINLSTTKMHFWEFQWLLWNMPRDRSSFIQAIEIRQKKPSKNASKEEKQQIKKAHSIYDLDQRPKEFTREEKAKIDDVDRVMAEIRKRG